MRNAIRRGGILFLLTLALFLLGCAGKTAEWAEPSAEAPLPTPLPEPVVPTEAPAELPEQEPPVPEPTPFSIVWITDTQYLVYEQDAYRVLGEWIAEQKESRNICLVAGTGDFVQTFTMDYQWDEFRKFREAFQDSIPAVYISGNHDMRLKNMTYERFIHEIYGEGGAEVQAYNRGQGKYELLSAGGLDWLIIGVSYGYGRNEAQWVREILEMYPDRKAIILLHDYLYRDGSMVENGRQLFATALEPCENARLVLCGHNAGFHIRTDEHSDDGGYFMQTIFCNRQSFDRQTGSIQLLRIDPAEAVIEFDYFSPINERAESFSMQIPIDLH